MHISNTIKLKISTKARWAKLTPYFIKWIVKTPKIWWINFRYGNQIKTKKTNLFWYNKTLNFGDWIGPYLFEKITKKQPTYKVSSNKDSHSVYHTVGSIINLTKRNSIVWGSGIMDSKTFFIKPHKTYAVRGPLTRKRFLEMGYECPEIYGDPALLMPVFFNPKPKKTHEVGIIPHNNDLDKIISLYKNQPSIKIISVLDSVENVITNILSCEHLISSSLHGIILGNAYKIPAAWVHFSLKLPGDDVKFYDYFLSVKMNNISKPIDLRNSKALSTKELINLIKGFPQPSSYPLIDEEALLRACPFNP